MPADTISVPAPIFDIATVWVAVVPTLTVPKNKVDGPTLRMPDEVTVEPAPESTKVGLLAALEVNVKFPVTLPVAVGLNVIVMGTVVPASGSVMGNWVVGTVNRLLSTEAAVIVMFPVPAPPVFDNCTVIVEEVPV